MGRVFIYTRIGLLLLKSPIFQLFYKNLLKNNSGTVFVLLTVRARAGVDSHEVIESPGF